MKKNIVLNNIYIIDDDLNICRSLSDLLNDSGYKTVYYTDPTLCLKEINPSTCDLVIVDYRMPQMNGLDFTKHVKNIFPDIPIIILTGYGDIPTAVTAMKTGAVNFLQKPFDKTVLLRIINEILTENNDIKKRKNSLTKMENKVYKLILDGHNNKQCAKILNRSRRTIETHRANLMKKFEVNNVVDLIKKSSESYNQKSSEENNSFDNL